jgi:diguanylate cyclase (GGDEF)-like protein/PAS domain S-box-containing protein
LKAKSAGGPRTVAASRVLWCSIALGVVALAWVGLQWHRPLLPPVLGWVPSLGAIICALTACIQTARSPRVAVEAARFWRHLAIAMVFMVGAQVSNCADALVGQAIPSQRTGPATLMLYITGVMIVAWALVRLPIRRNVNQHVVTFGLTFGMDMAIVMAGAVLIAWDVAIRGSVELEAVTGTGWATVGIALLGLTGLLALAKVSLAGAGALDRGSLWTLGGTLIVGVIGGALAPLLAGRPWLNDGQVVMAVACVGMVLAAVRQRCAATAGRARVARRKRPFSYVPYIAVGITDALLLVGVGHDQGETGVLIIGSVVLTGLVVARQLISIYENTHLLGKVDASMLELRRHERRFRSLVQNSSDVIVITDEHARLTYASPGLSRMLGIPPDRVVGVRVLDYVHRDDAETLRTNLAGLIGAGEPATTQVRIRHHDGSWRWLEIVSTNLLNDPSVGGIVSNARDVTDTRQVQDQLAYQASHDALTGLANRSLFNDRTARAVADGGVRLALALIDLDDFKEINDRLGHAVGDALLVAVSERLRSCVRPGDLVARLGGDEFAVLLTDVSPGDGARIAGAFIDALSVPVRAAGYELLVQASIGLARHTPDCDATDLLRRADVAMYAAKELGKSRWVEYGPDLDARAVEHARVAAELSVGIDRGELEVLYQPIVGLPGGALCGVEALVRWRHPERGTVSPADFVPIAERTGLIVPIGAWVLRQACRQGAAWWRAYGPAAPAKISVNASARQLVEPAFAITVAEAIKESGLEPWRLTIEITETAVFGGGRALDTVRQLHELGVKIALDDFGTGHSSLGLLRTCPVDVLKVDKSFVDGVTGTLEQEAIATSISEIAQALGLEAIAEGVETAAQAERLFLLGYRLAQGFHFDRPLTVAEVDRRCASVAAEVLGAGEHVGGDVLTSGTA